MTTPISRSLISIVLTVTLCACVAGRVPKPTAELELAESALERAESSGAGELAPWELRVAYRKKKAADVAIENKRYAKARYLSLEARVDADLATAKAQAMHAELLMRRTQDKHSLLRTDTLSTRNN